MIVGPFHALDTTIAIRAPRRIAALLGRAYGDLARSETVSADSTISIRRRLARSWCVEDRDDMVLAAEESEALAQCLRSVDDLAGLSASASATVLRGGAVEIDGVAIAALGSRRDVDAAIAAAVGAGHAYVAGGAVALVDGLARPFHRPLKWRQETASLLGVVDGDMRVGDPWRVGTTGRLSEGAPLVAISVLGQRASPEPQTVSPFSALSQLAGHATAAVGNERRMFRRLESLIRQVPTFSIPSDIDLLARSLESVADGLR